MTKHSLIAAFTAVAVTVATVVTPASASDRGFEVKPVRQNGKSVAGVAGAVLGLGSLLLAAGAYAKAKNEERRYGSLHETRGHGLRPVGYAPAFVAEDDCFDKPVKRFDRYTGEMVIVGFKTVCR